MALSILLACGGLVTASDGGILADAQTSDASIEAFSLADATVPDVSAVPDATIADAPQTAIDAADATDGQGIVFGLPDANGCLYVSDASCTTIAVPSTVNVGCLASPPTPEGGVIDPGEYKLTQADWNAEYFDGSCPSKSTWAGTMEVCGNIIEWYDINDVHSDFIGNLVFTTIGSTLDTEQYCPSGPYYGAFGYTSGNGQLVINYGSGSAVVLVETFTKQ